MPYSPEIEQAMHSFYDSLSEKDRRCYAAIEVAKLGYGGVEYIASVLGCVTPRPSARDSMTWDTCPMTSASGCAFKGGGRKRCIDVVPHLEENFLRVVKDYTAGDPMSPDVKWTNLTLDQIAERLSEAGTPVSVTVVKQLLRKHHYVKRKARKSLSMGQHVDRNQQFENIARLKREYMG